MFNSIFNNENQVISSNVDSEKFTEKMFFSAESLGTLLGTRATAVFANTTALVLPAGSRTLFTINTPLKSGKVYQAYAVWGVDNATAGNINWYSGLHIYLEGQLVTGGAGLKTFVRSPAINRVYRSSLFSVYPVENASYNFFIDRRVDGADTFTGSVFLLGIEVEEVESITEAKVLNEISVPASKFASPFNGLRYPSIYGGGSLFTPITSDANFIYMGEPLNANVLQSGFAKINKTTKALVQSVTLTSPTAHDALIVAHNVVSVGFTQAGTVLLATCGHHGPINISYAVNGNLTSITPYTLPTEIATNSSYRKFINNPFSNETWLSIRGNDYSYQIYKWDETSKTFSRPLNTNFATGSTEHNPGSYGGQMAFKSATEHFVNTSWIHAGVTNRFSGYPRRNGSVISTVNNGAAYSSINGFGLYFPLAEGGDQRVAFPTNGYNATSVEGNCVVCSDGNPAIISTWQHADSNFREPWFAKWNGSKFVRQRLHKSLGFFSVGSAETVFVNNGRIATVFGEVEDWSAANNSVNIPAPYTPCKLICMYSDDNGETWTKVQLGLLGNWSGAYLDIEEFRRSNGKTLRYLGRDLLDGNNASFYYEAILP